MKQLLVLLVTLLPLFSACKKNPALAMEYREIAWDSLNEAEKASINSDWKTSLVRDETYRGRFVVAVIFMVSDETRQKKIAVYIDPDSKEVMGVEDVSTLV